MTCVSVPFEALDPAGLGRRVTASAPLLLLGTGCVSHRGGSPEAPSACHLLGGWETTARPSRDTAGTTEAGGEGGLFEEATACGRNVRPSLAPP